jgi:hypothetical protein
MRIYHLWKPETLLLLRSCLNASAAAMLLCLHAIQNAQYLFVSMLAKLFLPPHHLPYFCPQCQ